MTLHFAENDEDVGTGDRVFNVSAQGETRLEEFDILRQATSHHTAITRTLQGVAVTENALSLATESITGDSILNGFEIREVNPEE